MCENSSKPVASDMTTEHCIQLCLVGYERKGHPQLRDRTLKQSIGFIQFERFIDTIDLSVMFLELAVKIILNNFQ